MSESSIGFGFPAGTDTPVGVILPYIGLESSLPGGWLLCNGNTFDPVRFPRLLKLLSDVAGVYTNTLPDLRGRVPVGKDNMGGTSANRVTGTWADSIGGSSGEETHTLTVGEMPSHAHPGTVIQTGVGGATAYQTTLLFTDASATLPDTSNRVPSQGGGGGHNNMQPSITVNYIIKAE